MSKSFPSTITFVLRFWLDRSASEARWRGSIEHIPSGERSEFLRIEEMQSFIRKSEIFLDDTHGFQQKTERRERE